jgi:hypothetical protein
MAFLREKYPGVFDRPLIEDGQAVIRYAVGVTVHASSFPSIPELFDSCEDADDPPLRIDLRALDWNGGTELIAVRVKGKSMIDALIDEGDILILEDAPDPESGSLVAAQVTEGQYVIKRLMREEKNGRRRILLISENHDMKIPPIEINQAASGEFRIVGRVVGLSRPASRARLRSSAAS